MFAGGFRRVLFAQSIKGIIDHSRGFLGITLPLLLALVFGSLATESWAGTLKDGDIIVTAPDVGEILQIDPATGTQTAIASGGILIEPARFTIDRFGRLIVSDSGAGEVLSVNPETGVQALVPSVGIPPASVAVDQHGDRWRRK